MSMIHKRDTSTIIRSLSCSTKLVLSIAACIIIVLAQNIFLSAALMLFSYFCIVYEKQATLFKFIFISTVSMGPFMYLIYGSVVDDADKATYIGKFLGLSFYQAGIDKANKFFFRVAPLMAFLFLMFFSMEMTDIGTVMCKCGLPYKYSFIFIDSFMVIKVLSKDMEQIMDAQKARGLVTEGNLITRMKAFVPIIVPVVANSIAKVQDQAVAMDTKGFNADCKKSIYRELPHSALDSILTYGSLALTVLVIVLKIVKVI